MRNVLGVLALVGAVGVAAYVGLSSGERPPATAAERATPGQGDQPSPPALPAAPAAPAAAPAAPATDPAARAPAPPVAAPAAPRAAGRADLVATETLRELLNSEPRLAIDLAREANRRAPDSPDAAERAWIIVKALASLKRFHEAREEAAALASRHPDSPWALDAKRHLLVHPLDLPSREEQQKRERSQGTSRDE